jgi:2-aminoadipate transaminase
VPLDDDGMRIDLLESLLDRLKRDGELGRVKLVYTVDYFQNPTGLTLSRDRRRALVELVRRFSEGHRILILEDAAYRELRFEGEDLPSLKRSDPTNEFVVYTGTFSKSCSPGLKTGYAIAPRDVLEPMMHLKGSHDFGSTNVAQHLVSRLIASGAYARQIEKLRAVYRRKRDLTLAALEREFGGVPGVRWTVPAGGLYVWLTLDGLATGPDGPLVPAGLETGVLYVPGEFGYVPGEGTAVPRNQCRICYGVATPEEIPEGIRRLRKAFDLATAGRKGSPARSATAVG